MTDEMQNGAVSGGDNANTETETQSKVSGGDSANTDSADKAELASRDKKIAELLKANEQLLEAAAKEKQEREARELASKSAEEQLAAYKERAEKLERERTFQQAFKKNGLDPDKFQNVIASGNYEQIASTISAEFEQKTQNAVNEALEKFKADTLAQTAKDAPKTTDAKSDSSLDMMKAAMGV